MVKMSVRSYRKQNSIGIPSLSSELIIVFVVTLSRAFQLQKNHWPIVSQNPFTHSTDTFRCSQVPIERRASCGNSFLGARCAQPPIPVGNIFTLRALDRSLSKEASWCANWFTRSVFRLRSPRQKRKPPIVASFHSGTSRHVLEILLLDEIKKQCHRDGILSQLVSVFIASGFVPAS